MDDVKLLDIDEGKVLSAQWIISDIEVGYGGIVEDLILDSGIKTAFAQEFVETILEMGRQVVVDLRQEIRPDEKGTQIFDIRAVIVPCEKRRIDGRR